MDLPSRLNETTLGDLLGASLRARVTGVMRLEELGGAGSGRVHLIHLTFGRVVAVDTPVAVAPLGEILRRRGLIDATIQRRLGVASRRGRVGERLVEEHGLAPAVIDAALRQQLRAKLDLLFGVFAARDAAVSFHVACPKPRAVALPLLARDYLHGRSRARDRGARTPRARSRNDPREHEAAGPRSRALALLGLDRDASIADVTRAFRALAVELHPDRHSGAAGEARRALERRFAALSAAYHELIG